ncbi:MAG TPA: hypothetical protein VJ719_10745, partial [Chthoniobacterales bacterium]|nr:hypothetical protein [Chthoniobacterales bacterium]
HDPDDKAVRHFEGELARITGVHPGNRQTEPAAALGNLFGKLPLSRTPLLKSIRLAAAAGQAPSSNLQAPGRH